MKEPRGRDAECRVDDVDFSSFRLRKREVSVDGKALPFRIGDRIVMSKDDRLAKTVMGITVHEDGRCQYILEWHNPDTGAFSSEALTLSELKLMHANINKRSGRPRIGFAAAEES